MNILTILILSSMATARMLDMFQKETCDLETCQRVEDAFDEFCDVNADDISIYSCFCDNMPDSFFQDFYDCAIGCGEYTEEDSPEPSSLRSLYCELASETELPSGYYDFTEVESDFEIGSETIDFDTETIDFDTESDEFDTETINFDTQSDEFGIITETKTTMTGPDSELRTRTSISKTVDLKTIKSGTNGGSETSNPGIINGHISINTGTTSSRTSSSETSSSQTSSSQTSSSQTTSSESTTTVNGADIINSGLFSCIALILAMLI